jgi:type VI secretion system secreted protein VgrG
MAIQVRAVIEIGGGKKITSYTRVYIEQYMFKAHNFRIDVPFEQLEKKGENFFQQAHKDVIGKTISISYEGVLQTGSYKFEFNGIITDVVLRNRNDLSNYFSIKGWSADYMLEDSIVRRSFLGKNLKQIFGTVLGEYPGNVLQKSLKPDFGDVIPYTVQYDESNYMFLSRMASRYGEWFYFDGKKIIFGDPGSPKEFDYLINGSQVFELWIRLAEHVKFKMETYDYTNDKTYQGGSSDQQVEGLSQMNKFGLDESESLYNQDSLLTSPAPVYAQNELDKFVKLRRSAEAAKSIIFEGTGENPNFSVGCIISVTGTQQQKGGKLKKENFGKYRISIIKHLINEKGNYSNTFEAMPESLKIPYQNPNVKYPVGRPEVATITDNNDKDKLGRVKVDFNWPGSDKSSDWIRNGTFYSGGSDGKGMQFIPEKDAQVMVGYELNDPDRPFIMTSLYPKKDGTRAIKGSNEEKIIYTKAGNQITLIDKQGENSIEITNANKTDTSISIEFKDDGKINIKTNGDVSIEAKKTITIKADDKITLDGKDIEIKASNELKLEGTSKVSISGAQIKAEADSTIEIKGGAEAKFSSPMSEVSADGILTVKGSLVKIN